MEDKGNAEPGCSGWEFIDAEAECSDVGDDFEDLFEKSGSESLIDDTLADQGNSLRLLNELETQEDHNQLTELKRKFFHSPVSETVEETLSPRLAKVTLSSQRAKKIKKVLFRDSGVDETLETLESTVQEDSSELGAADEPASACSQEEQALDVTTLLKSSNVHATLLAKFKEGLGASFTELTRKFTSSRTMSDKWCVAVYGITERHFETVKPLLQEHCDFVYLMHFVCNNRGSFLFTLCEFKAQKCKETVSKLFRNLLAVQHEQMLLDPPKTRSQAVALFWYKKVVSDAEHSHGQLPEWIAQQVLVDHQLAAETPFQLCDMIWMMSALLHMGMQREQMRIEMQRHF